MTITVEASYENGVLRPREPLPLAESETVQVVIRRLPTPADQTFGMIGWAGDSATFDRLLEESESELAEHA